MGNVGRSRRARLIKASVTITLGVLAALAPATSASAGSWALLGCHQPNGQSAPTEGWSSGPLGAPAISDEALDTCAQPGGALIAVAGGDAQAASSGYQWRFAPPAGSTIAEGRLQLGLTAPHGIAAVLTSETNYGSPYQVVVCGLSESCDISGQSTTVAVGHPGAGGLYANAICFPFGEGCGQISGVNAKVSIYAAQVLLESNATPSGSDFTGGLLSADASGVQDLQFTASVPGGPGIWRVSATVDGKTVYDQTPDTNGGKCQSVGSGLEGAPEFLYQQPCKQTVAVSIPVNTSEFETGAHQLAVAVTDAAGNSATVFDQTISTFNASSQTPWKVSLRVAPRRVEVHKVIELTGFVLTTPRPPDGKLVILQARLVTFTHVGRGKHRKLVAHDGEWDTFKHERANAAGEYKASYKFRFAGHHVYQFQAIAPQEGGFDAATGLSEIVSVLET